MPNLGDYLGQLLAEVTIARMQADLEAVRVAELYASHPLLRHMSVPRFRLPEVELDVPVVISQMEEPRPGESPRGGVDIGDLREKFHEVMTKHLIREHIQTTPDETDRIRARMEETLSRAARAPETAVDVSWVADEMTSAVVEAIRDPSRPGDPIDLARVSTFSIVLRDAARVEFLKLRTAPPRLSVLVETAQIREAGNSDAVTRIRMKISESGVEWTTIESGGKEEDRLVPE